MGDSGLVAVSGTTADAAGNETASAYERASNAAYCDVAARIASYEGLGSTGMAVAGAAAPEKPEGGSTVNDVTAAAAKSATRLHIRLPVTTRRSPAKRGA